MIKVKPVAELELSDIMHVTVYNSNCIHIRKEEASGGNSLEFRFLETNSA